MLILGGGAMGVEHARAARSLGVSPTLLVRTEEKARRVSDSTGLRCDWGSLEDWIERNGAPTHAVVAANVEVLGEIAGRLAEAGVRELLVEKPGALDAPGLKTLEQATTGSEVFVAYNRRFYAPVRELRRRAAEEGGVTSVRFDFTELAWRVEEIGYPDEVAANWLMANSTHVIDTAFFLAGEPASLHAEVAGSLSWHPSASAFSGSGRTDRGAVFSYLADWTAPGRWSVDVRTAQSRYLLEPMEGLRRQAIRTMSVEDVEIDLSGDAGVKPGLLGQMDAFLNGRGREDLMTLSQQAARAARIYEPMVKGGEF